MPGLPETIRNDIELLQHTIGKERVIVLPDSRLATRNVLAAGSYHRTVMHTALVDYHLRSAETSETPQAWLTAGGGGAGKTAIMDLLEDRELFSRDNLIEINADLLKDFIPEYRELTRANDSRAASVVHEESSQIARNLLEQAIANQHSLIYDATLSNQEKGIKLINALHDAGYAIHLVAVTIRVPLAFRRAEKREADEKRHVPFEELVQAHWKFNRNLPIYLNMMDESDVAYVYDNSKEYDPVRLPSFDLLSHPDYVHTINERSFPNA